MIEKSENVHCKDKHGWAPLHLAVAVGHEIVNLCLTSIRRTVKGGKLYILLPLY